MTVKLMKIMSIDDIISLYAFIPSHCCTPSTAVALSTARDLDFEGIFSDMVSGLLGSGGAAAVHQAPGAPSQVYLLRSMINPDVSIWTITVCV